MELYTAATNLATLLNDQLSKAEKALVGARPAASYGPSSRPCVNFMAIVLVVAKLSYGLDDRIRWVWWRELTFRREYLWIKVSGAMTEGGGMAKSGEG